MTDYKRVFLDTAPIIYFLDKDVNFGERAKNIINSFFKSGIELATSAITFEEYLVHPYRSGNTAKKQSFEGFISLCSVDVIVIDDIVADKAAQIRAKYDSFKAMDALQLAAAMASGCDVFLTNDKQLRQFDGLKCLTLDDVE